MEVALRRLSCLCIFLFLFFFCSYVFRVEASRRVFLNPNASEPSIASKEYRTAYHFQPPDNWINAPRVIWLADGGKQLIQWPIKELESLRKKEVSFQGIGLKTGALFRVKGIKASQADVEVEFELPSLEGVEPLDPAWLLDPQGLCGKEGASVGGVVGPFGLLVLASYNLQEHTAVFFRVFKGHDSRYIVLMCADLRRSSFRTEVDKPTFGGFLDLDVGKEGKISLKTLIDHSVIESFGGGGRTCITARVYPTFLSTGNGRMYAFNNGTKTVRISKLKAWSMAKARIDKHEIIL